LGSPGRRLIQPPTRDALKATKFSLLLSETGHHRNRRQIGALRDQLKQTDIR
jgi:hypothetical protein